MKTPGGGLAKGLGSTLRTMTSKSVTREYPDADPVMPPRSRGVIALLEENCTVCMLCARECPDWCIYIDSHKETVEMEQEGARARVRNQLDRFAIDFSLCMYCGICIDVCPFDALFWSPEFEYAESDIKELTHEKKRLGAWLATVPPPAPFEEDAAAAKEVEAALAAGLKPEPPPAPVADTEPPAAAVQPTMIEPAEVAPPTPNSPSEAADPPESSQ